MIDVIGRKGVQSSSLGLGSLALFALLGVRGGVMRTVTIFVGRAAILSAFTALFIITPELYPTRIRARAFGIANSLSRIGGMVAPFVGQGLVARGRINTAVYIFGALCVTAAISSLFMGSETAGKPLDGMSPAGGAAAGGGGIEGGGKEDGGREALLSDGVDATSSSQVAGVDGDRDQDRDRR